MARHLVRHGKLSILPHLNCRHSAAAHFALTGDVYRLSLWMNAWVDQRPDGDRVLSRDAREVEQQSRSQAPAFWVEVAM